MAETLGSLVDKLTIKSIREYYINEMIKEKKPKFPKAKLKEKLKILGKQKKEMMLEVEEFVDLATKGVISLADEKIKLYNRPDQIGRIGKIKTLGKAIEGLSKKNLEIWHLEDQARRTDVPLNYIGQVKRKIDSANQQRNDFIDKIDELLAQDVKKKRSRAKKK
jgi:hypothetical protein